MGTRSLTRVYDKDGAEIICMYRQFDGYPSGHGAELACFLAPFRIVNGLRLDEKAGEIANGMGCLAAQIVAHFKRTPGGFYLYPPGTSDVNEDYEYAVELRDGRVSLKCFRVDGGY